MVPFQTAYPMIFFMVFLILAGNTAFVSPLLRSGSKNDQVITLTLFQAYLVSDRHSACISAITLFVQFTIYDVSMLSSISVVSFKWSI